MEEVETYYRLITSHGVLDVGYNRPSFHRENKGEYHVITQDGGHILAAVTKVDHASPIPCAIFEDIVDTLGSNIIIKGVLCPRRLLYEFEKYDVELYYDSDLDPE